MRLCWLRVMPVSGQPGPLPAPVRPQRGDRIQRCFLELGVELQLGNRVLFQKKGLELSRFDKTNLSGRSTYVAPVSEHSLAERGHS
jgi:hypothetical protein